MIEKDTRLKKGIGIGYTPPDKPCSVFCLHVPEGSQLLIGVADLEHQLSLYVLDILFENWDPGLPPNIGMLAGTNRIIVAPRTKITNPSGRYYIYVCPGGDPGKYWDYGNEGDTLYFTDTTYFTLYNEFTP
jgi:hypothetical protein